MMQATEVWKDKYVLRPDKQQAEDENGYVGGKGCEQQIGCAVAALDSDERQRQQQRLNRSEQIQDCG
jgi:hypothetical protein